MRFRLDLLEYSDSEQAMMTAKVLADEPAYVPVKNVEYEDGKVFKAIRHPSHIKVIRIK